MLECATLWWLHSAEEPKRERKEGTVEEGEKPVGTLAGSLLLALSSTGHARSLDRTQNDLRSVLMLRKIAEQGAFTN